MSSMNYPYAAMDVEPEEFKKDLGKQTVDLGGKTCEAKSCGRTFYRNPGESTADFRNRRTCGGKCHRELVGFLRSQRAKAARASKNGEVYSWISPDEITCANCSNWDNEKACATCEGQNFRYKKEK